MQKPFAELLELQMPGLIRSSSAAGGHEPWTFRFWCYTAQTAPASPPHQQFSQTSCEVKMPLYRSPALPGPCLLCSSSRLCEVSWRSPDNTQQTHSIKCQHSLFLIKHSAPSDSALTPEPLGSLPVIENEQNKIKLRRSDRGLITM